MQISDYMPKLYSNNKEMMNIINSEELELENNLKPYIEDSFKDTFAVEATETGIEKFEKLLNIPVDTETEDLDFRRARVLSRLVSSIPFTETYLQNKLNALLGEGNWSYTINYNNYNIVIRSLKPGDAWYRELLDFLDRTIPCNMEWSVDLYAATWAQVDENYPTWQDVFDTDMTWEELMDGEWL